MGKTKLIAILLTVLLVILAVSCKNEASEPVPEPADVPEAYEAPEGFLGAWVKDLDEVTVQITLNDDGTCTSMVASVDYASLLSVDDFDYGSYSVYEGEGDLEAFDIICTDVLVEVDSCTEELDGEEEQTTETGGDNDKHYEYINLFYNKNTGEMFYSTSDDVLYPDVVEYEATYIFDDYMPSFENEVKRPEYLLEVADDQVDIEGIWMTYDSKDNGKNIEYREYTFENGKASHAVMTLSSAITYKNGDYRSCDGSFVLIKTESNKTTSEKYSYLIYEYGGEKYLEFTDTEKYQKEDNLLKKIDESNYDSSVKTNISGVYTATNETKGGTLTLGIYGEYAQTVGENDTSVSYDGRSIFVEDEDGLYDLSDERDMSIQELKGILGDTASFDGYETYKKGTITFTPDEGFARSWTYFLLVKDATDKGFAEKTLILVDEKANVELKYSNKTTG